MGEGLYKYIHGELSSTNKGNITFFVCLLLVVVFCWGAGVCFINTFTLYKDVLTDHIQSDATIHQILAKTIQSLKIK